MTGHLEAAQLSRRAFVYVRQSSMTQVLHHQESAMMQLEILAVNAPLFLWDSRLRCATP
jgi:hypothetical protein